MAHSAARSDHASEVEGIRLDLSMPRIQPLEKNSAKAYQKETALLGVQTASLGIQTASLGIQTTSFPFHGF